MGTGAVGASKHEHLSDEYYFSVKALFFVPPGFKGSFSEPPLVLCKSRDQNTAFPVRNQQGWGSAVGD